MSNKQIEVRPMSGAVGAEIVGVDLSQALADSELAIMREAFDQHGVIFLRDQNITPEQHIAFASRIGVININRFFKAVPGYPQIAEVRKEPEQKTNIGGAWPPKGGDTMFASMGLAFDALSDGLRRTLEGMRAVHSSRHVFGAEAAYRKDSGGRLGNAEAATQDAVHPVVIRHPQTGRKVLYVNPGFTTHFEGWSAAESQPLLGYLYQHASRPEFQTRFSWQAGSIAFWDNRATWHLAINDYHGERRLMHRITLEGVPIH